VRRDTQIDVRVQALERLDAWQQPERRERREGGHVHALAAALLADLAHARVDAGQRRLDAAQQQLAVLRQLHMARAAHEQRRAQLVFQALDLAADGRLGDEQLLRRIAEVQPPGDGLEGAQVGQRERAAAWRIHISSA